MNTTKPLAQVAAVVLLVSGVPSASAHFPWLSTDEAGHVVMWFGEALTDRNDQFPDRLAEIEIRSGDAAIRMETVNTESFVGLRSIEPSSGLKKISASVVYGNHQDSKLTYYVEHLPQQNPATWPGDPRANVDFQTVITQADAGSIDALVLHQNKPLAGAEVKLFNPDGEEVGSGTTDENGKVNLPPNKLSLGLNGLLIGFSNETSGTYQGENYERESIYLTATFFVESLDEAVAAQAIPTIDPTSTATITATDYPDLPEELTSFGAAIAGGKLYVYGGHTGTAHSYSVEEQSNRLWGLDLAKGAAGQWQALAGGPRIQGLALVAAGQNLVRIGGFSALNKAGEQHQLQSQAAVAMYHTSDNTWSQLPSLPEPRSSLDAAVLDGKIYVVGGWSLNGDFESEWLPTAWSLDLSDLDSGWVAIADPPLMRRALSVAAYDGKLHAIGGMESTNKTITRVDIYDPKTNQWSQGPSIPGSGMSGFGTAAFAAGDSLYVSAMDGFVHQLSGSKEKWRTIAQLDPSRFFHRMLPISADRLILVGGANMEIGKFTDLEMVRVR